MSTVWEDVAPYEQRTLADEHRATLVEQSGIDPAVIEGRGYYSLDREQIFRLIELEVIEPSAKNATGWMGIPIIKPDGQIHGEIIRLFGGSSGSMKYVWPTGKRNAIDVHPDSLVDLADPSIPIIVTEGVKKADAILSAARAEGYRCVVLALNGCWGWKAKVNGSSVAVPDFYDIPLDDRKVFVVVDSDYRTNDDVRHGWDDCATYLEGKTGPHRVFLVVVPSKGLDKQGADDFLAGGGSLHDLLGLATTPRQSLLGESSVPRALVVRGGLRLIREASDEIPHLIAPILPERGIMVMAGHSGTFKTWHALTLCLDGAFGLAWIDHPDFGKRDRPFSSLYVNKEMGGIILAHRLKKLVRNDRYRNRPDFEEVLENRVLTTDEAELDLASPTQRDRLEEAIRELRVEHVVLDSLSMCWSGNENDNSEVGAFYAKLRGITERTGVSWTIIHHLDKPQTGRNKIPAKFSVRGAGQIIQQADAAIILSPYNEEQGIPDVREIGIESVKTRTEREPAPFLTRFEIPDGIYATIGYASSLSAATASAYVKSDGDATRFGAWISTELTAMPAMAPGGVGLRTKQLVALLQAAWPDKQPPSEDTIRRRLKDLVDLGSLELLDASRKHGDLYRFRSDDGQGAVRPNHIPPAAPGSDRGAAAEDHAVGPASD